MQRNDPPKNDQNTIQADPRGRDLVREISFDDFDIAVLQALFFNVDWSTYRREQPEYEHWLNQTAVPESHSEDDSLMCRHQHRFEHEGLRAEFLPVSCMVCALHAAQNYEIVWLNAELDTLEGRIDAEDDEDEYRFALLARHEELRRWLARARVRASRYTSWINTLQAQFLEVPETEPAEVEEVNYGEPAHRLLVDLQEDHRYFRSNLWNGSFRRVDVPELPSNPTVGDRERAAFWRARNVLTVGWHDRLEQRGLLRRFMCLIRSARTAIEGAREYVRVTPEEADACGWEETDRDPSVTNPEHRAWRPWKRDALIAEWGQWQDQEADDAAYAEFRGLRAAGRRAVDPANFLTASREVSIGETREAESSGGDDTIDKDTEKLCTFGSLSDLCKDFRARLRVSAGSLQEKLEKRKSASTLSKILEYNPSAEQQSQQQQSGQQQGQPQAGSSGSRPGQRTEAEYQAMERRIAELEALADSRALRREEDRQRRSAEMDNSSGAHKSDGGSGSGSSHDLDLSATFGNAIEKANQVAQHGFDSLDAETKQKLEGWGGHGSDENIESNASIQRMLLESFASAARGNQTGTDHDAAGSTATETDDALQEDPEERELALGMFLSVRDGADEGDFDQALAAHRLEHDGATYDTFVQSLLSEPEGDAMDTDP